MAARWTTLGLEIWEKMVKPLDGDSRIGSALVFWCTGREIFGVSQYINDPHLPSLLLEAWQ